MGTRRELTLYLLTPRTLPIDDEHYAESIVAAFDIREAKLIHPAGDDEVEWNDEAETWGHEDDDFSWVPPYEVAAEEVGTALPHIERGVVLSRWREGDI
jgi:hypothetical protein